MQNTFSKIRSIIQLIRPQQWAKNMFIFVPMFFSGNIFNPDYWNRCIFAFITFSLVASSIYCINDIHDVKSDRTHPKKRFRPVASRAISIVQASVISIILLFAAYALILSDITPLKGASYIISAYVMLNLAYCFYLKRFAIIDVFIIATGFVLRLVLGGTVCQIWLSPWIVCLTFLLSLFLAFAKRRDDVILRESKGIVARKNILSYNSEFMNQTLGIIAAITMVCYIIYSVSPDVELRLGSHYIYITSIFVLAGILRYLQIAMVFVKSGSPTKILLKDHFIQLCILGWILSFLIIIYIL